MASRIQEEPDKRPNDFARQEDLSLKEKSWLRGQASFRSEFEGDFGAMG
jgi:hypothetical protein